MPIYMMRPSERHPEGTAVLVSTGPGLRLEIQLEMWLLREFISESVGEYARRHGLSEESPPFSSKPVTSS